MNKYKTKLLSNKLPLHIIPLEGAKTATVLFMFRTGSRYENRENSGLSHFLEHMFFKGTKNRPNTMAISGELDALGGEFNAFTAKEYTGYFVKVAAAKLKPAIEVLNDMLLNSLFEEKEIEREKGVIIEEYNMYENNPMMHIEDVFENCLFGDTPAGWDTIGTKENIKAFKRQDFIDYFKMQYGTKSLSVVLAGNVNSAAIKTAEKLLLGFQKNSWQKKIAVKNNQKAPQFKISYKNGDQTTIALGVRTVPMGHKLELKLKLLSVILGGSMSSRLFINLRERNGLAYYVRTSTEYHSDAGYLDTQAGIPTAKVKEAVKIILAEYKKLKNELVGQEELKKAKDLIKGRLFLHMEASDEVASWYGKQAALRGKIITPAKFLTEIDKITSADLRRAAAQVFVNKNLNFALIGKAKAEEFKGILKF
jgi:predicted Zn-dependent peptidase